MVCTTKINSTNYKICLFHLIYNFDFFYLLNPKPQCLLHSLTKTGKIYRQSVSSIILYIIDEKNTTELAKQKNPAPTKC